MPKREIYTVIYLRALTSNSNLFNQMRALNLGSVSRQLVFIQTVSLCVIEAEFLGLSWIVTDIDTLRGLLLRWTILCWTMICYNHSEGHDSEPEPVNG